MRIIGGHTFCSQKADNCGGYSGYKALRKWCEIFNNFLRGGKHKSFCRKKNLQTFELFLSVHKLD